MVVPILDPIRIASAPFSPMIFDSNNVCKIPIAAADDWITAVNAVPTRSPKIGIDENLANRSVANLHRAAPPYYKVSAAQNGAWGVAVYTG